MIAVLSISYITLIFNVNIWTDEAYTIQLVGQNSIKEIIAKTADDVHPPLYYLIAKIFTSLFGGSIQVYKIVSVIPMVFTMILSYVWVRPWFGTRTAVFHVLFLNAIPCVMEYIVQIRMYSWTIFFITLCGLAAYGVWRSEGSNGQNGSKKGVRGRRYWVWLLIGAMAACYTHNFAMISAFFIYVLLGIAFGLKRKKIPGEWFASGGLIGVGYLPWLLVLLQQTTTRVGNYWIEEITAETVLGYPKDVFGSDIPYTTLMFLILCVLGTGLMLYRYRTERGKSIYVFSLLAIPLLTAAVGVLISVLVTPFFIARYLLPCMGLLALALAIPFAEIRKMSRLFLGLFLLCMIINSYHANYELEYRNSHTEELLAYMD